MLFVYNMYCLKDCLFKFALFIVIDMYLCKCKLYICFHVSELRNLHIV